VLSAGVVASREGTAGKLGMLLRLGMDSSGRTWLEVAGTGALAKAAMGRPAAWTGPMGSLPCGPRGVSCGPKALMGLPWGPKALGIDPCGPRGLGGLA